VEYTSCEPAGFSFVMKAWEPLFNTCTGKIVGKSVELVDPVT